MKKSRANKSVRIGPCQLLWPLVCFPSFFLLWNPFVNKSWKWKSYLDDLNLGNLNLVVIFNRKMENKKAKVLKSSLANAETETALGCHIKVEYTVMVHQECFLLTQRRTGWPSVGFILFSKKHGQTLSVYCTAAIKTTEAELSGPARLRQTPPEPWLPRLGSSNACWASLFRPTGKVTNLKTGKELFWRPGILRESQSWRVRKFHLLCWVSDSFSVFLLVPVFVLAKRIQIAIWHWWRV